MTRNWTILELQAVLAAILLAAPSPVRAADPEKEPLQEIVRRLENIEKGMTEIQKSAAAIKAEGLKINLLKGRIDKLEEQLSQVKPVVDALKKLVNGNVKQRVSTYPPDAVDDLARRVAELEKKLAPSVRVAKAPPDVGRVVLTNRYAEEITFVLNNRDIYRVLPGMTQVVEGYPAGVFTYEIRSPSWGPRDRTTSTLPVNQTVRLTVD
jgi:hypothetical protein